MPAINWLFLDRNSKIQQGQASPVRPTKIMSACSAMAASPISWTHYQVLQYPGLALLLHHALRRRAWMLSGATLVLGGLLYPLPVAVLRAYYRQFGAWTAASPATLYVWTSVAPLAALVLFGVLLWQVKRAVEPRPAR